MLQSLPLPARLLSRLTSASPALRRELWRFWYRALARRLPQPDWTFMNFGYVHADPNTPPLPLQEADEADRHCIQLYHRLTAPIDLTGLEVLEVGAGRGGGSSFLRRYAGAASVVGVDRSPEAVALCQRAIQVPGVSFQEGDAEALPFPNGSFDALVNVESSHCYGSLPRFFGEAYRVLRPEGYFLWADLCPSGGVDGVLRQMRDAGFLLASQEEVTAGVVQALQETSARKRDVIEVGTPRFLAPYLALFAGVEGTGVYEGLRRGETEYYCARLLRPVES